ncbi:MAG TPA: hypothetical protein VGV68_12930, partial [Terriglobia bacterium]|nr:hypothetical protein [Terriglobia bacterium]
MNAHGASPSANLSLLFGAGNNAPAPTGLSVAPNGIVAFASGQTFPGTGNGTITGVTAGSGLVGGGMSGNIQLAVDPTVARTNASNMFGAAQIVNGTMTATSFTGSGAGLTNLPTTNLTGTISDGNLPGDVPRLGLANTFTSPQTVTSNVSGGSALTASNSSGNSVFGSGSNYGVAGVSNAGNGVSGSSGAGSGVYGSSLAGNNAGNILLGQSGNVTKFSVDGKGDVAASGSVSIGGGTPIIKHLSIQVSATFPGLKPGTCTAAIFTHTGAADGDTIAMGVPNAMMTVAGVPIYSAWVSAAD